MPVGGPGPFARGRTQFFPSVSNKKKSRPTTTKHRGATREPPGSRTGDRCSASVGGPGPFARGRTQFYPSHSNKNKVATHNDKAPRSHQGVHFWDPGPPGYSRKNYRIRTTDGKWEMRGSNMPWAKGPANFVSVNTGCPRTGRRAFM